MFGLFLGLSPIKHIYLAFKNKMALKTSFSTSEINLLSNKSLFKTKALVTHKINQQLLDIEEIFSKTLEVYHDELDDEIFSRKGKITRGENLNASPWMVLDFPRVFSKDNIFAIRTLVWWGNHTSVSLVLSGNYKKKYEERVLLRVKDKRFKDLFVCVGDTPWQHDFTTGNYLKSPDVSNKVIKEIKQKEFLKVSFKMPLKRINEIQKLTSSRFDLLLTLLKTD